MGGQQFLTGGTLLDMRSMSRVLGVDRDRGMVDVEAGILWSDLVPELRAMQDGDGPKWSIVQKQTGADRLSLGGAIAANGHGRGLRFRPIVQDVESFTLVDCDGELRECSRSANADLFRAAIGGYGLFGVITSMRLRLQPRHRLERVVEVFDVEGLPDAFRSRIDDGFTYGDFQYMTDESSGGFLRQGVFSCYRPTDAAPSNGGRANVTLSTENWTKLIHLAHVDKARAFEEYVRFYTSTSGQTYDSDDFQMSTYIDGYHAALDAAAGATSPGSETITELYVPLEALAGFMDASRKVLTAHGSNVIYGTIRLIEPEHETLLGWAGAPVCLHSLQSTRRTYAAWCAGRGGRPERPDRGRALVWRELLPDLQPLRYQRSVGARISAFHSVSGLEAPNGSGQRLLQRLVRTLPRRDLPDTVTGDFG